MDASRESLREHVLLELAKQDYGNRIEAFQSITEATAVALDVERVSIWRLLPESEGIACEDLFTRSTRSHEHGLVLYAHDYPHYFEVMLQSRTIPADDASNDPRTREFAESYLAPRGITSMLDVPIWHNGALYGILCHEHLGTPRHWSVDETELAGNLSDLIALALERSERRAVESRWTTVMDEIAEAVFVFDTDLTIVQMNTPARELLGRTGGMLLRVEDRNELVEYRDLNGRLVPPEGRPLARAVRGQQSSSVLVITSKLEGVIGTFRVTASPITEEGHITSYVVVLDDVTKAVEDEQLKAEFLSALAHELKTPATVVKGFTELLIGDPRLPEAYKDRLRTIGRASSRTERLIADAVEMAGLTIGRLALSREPVELRGLVESLVASVAAASPSHPIRVSAPGEVVAVLDRQRIEEVVRRLLENAVRHSPDRAGIDVGIVVAPARVTVSVRDHGYGIPYERQKAIFDAFCGADGASTGGLGIGLHLAREIVRLHGGDMSLRSIEGKGSLFTFWLPCEVPQ